MSVKEAVQSSYLACFESFQVNLRSEELCKNGERIKLPGQSFRILAMLLERPGEVVMRQEIQRKLWPNDTVVEFENSINAAIKRLRAALGDSADQPRYIETLARRGYRWMVPVQWIEPPSTSATVLSSANPAEVVRTAPRKRRWLLIVSAAVVVVAALAASAYFFTHRTPKLTSKDSIIIADFVNTTGDPVFDGTLRQGLMAQLQQSPYFDIRSDEQLAGTLRLMGQAPGARLTNELAQQVCQRTGGAAVLDGSIAQIGSQYSLILSVLNCSSGALLASAQEVASDKNHVLGALGNVASSIRRKLGESPASIGKFDTPLVEVTTPSLEALKAYNVSWQVNLRTDSAAVIASRQLQRAISLDPNFAMAYAVLGTSYYNLNETGLAAENMKKAYELRDRVSERERFYISSHYEEFVTGNELKANEIYEMWAQTYPRDFVPVTNLTSGYLLLGQYQKALATARRALEMDPDAAVNYENVADSYLCLDRLDEAAAVLQQARAHRIHSLNVDAPAYELAFLEGNTEGTAQETAWAADKRGIEDLFLDYESDTVAYAGHLVLANDLTARAAASARQAGQKDTAGLYLASAALRQALVGNVAEARQRATVALRTSNGRHTVAVVALTLALVGGTAHARVLADDLARRFPQDTVVQFHYLPTIRAAIALGQKSPAKAITELQVAAPYELGTPALKIFVNLYPVYVRGQAYLAAGQGVAASAEFQKILDHPGIAFNEVIRLLAHLQIGKAYAMQGETAKAKAAYQEFLTLWKDADPGIPVLIAAKSEYAKLQ